jgi:hypothetical protein
MQKSAPVPDLTLQPSPDSCCTRTYPHVFRDLIQGALDTLIMKIVALQSMNGWTISQRLKQIPSGVLAVSDGSLGLAHEELPSVTELDYRDSDRLARDSRKSQDYFGFAGKRESDNEPASDFRGGPGSSPWILLSARLANIISSARLATLLLSSSTPAGDSPVPGSNLR